MCYTVFAEEEKSMTDILPLRDSKTPLRKSVDAANPKVKAVLLIHLRTACLVIHGENILVRGGITKHTQKTCVACMPGHTLVLALLQDWKRWLRLLVLPRLINVFSTGESHRAKYESEQERWSCPPDNDTTCFHFPWGLMPSALPFEECH